jgi:membrane-associated phospholipid phosphatase
MATVFYGALCALVMAKVRDWRARGLVVVVGACLILLVGFSRIYLGVHYLSDVMAAIAEGLTWLAFCLIAVEGLGRRRKRKRGQ